MIEPDDFFAALADPTRRRILALLQAEGERCVCVLYETLDLPQPKVSRHLGVLRAAGIVATRREGLWIHYRLHPDPTRRRILALLQAEGERCVCVLYETLDLPQPKVSRHLGVLRAAGIVATRREGLWIHYRLHPDLPEWAHVVLGALAESTGSTGGQAAACGACKPAKVVRRSTQRRGHRNA